MSKITGIVEKLRASEEIVKRFPALRQISPESFHQIEEMHRKLVKSEHWAKNDKLRNASLVALREASEFYTHVVQDGRFAAELEKNPRAAAASLGRKVSDEAIDILKNLREALAVSVRGPGDSEVVVPVAVAIVVVAVEVTVAVGITVVTVSPPPPPPEPPPAPDPPPGPDPGPGPDPPPGPDPEPDPPPPPDERQWFENEIELELSEVVIAFERTLIELDRAIERGEAIPQIARGARDLSGKGKL